MKKTLIAIVSVVGSFTYLQGRADLGDMASPTAAVSKTECSELSTSGFDVTNLTKGSTDFATLNVANGCAAGTHRIRTTYDGGKPREYCVRCKGRLCSRPNTTDEADPGFGCAVPSAGVQALVQPGGGMIQLNP